LLSQRDDDTPCGILEKTPRMKGFLKKRKKQWKRAMEKSNGKSLRHFKSNGKKCSPIAVRFEAALCNGRDVSFAKSARKNYTQRNCEEQNRSSHHMVTFVYFVTAGCGP
jgi:hypothetical protein